MDSCRGREFRPKLVQNSAPAQELPGECGRSGATTLRASEIEHPTTFCRSPADVRTVRPTRSSGVTRVAYLMVDPKRRGNFQRSAFKGADTRWQTKSYLRQKSSPGSSSR